MTSGPGPSTDRGGTTASAAVSRQAVQPRLAPYVLVAAVRSHSRVEGTSVLEHGKRRGIYRNFDAEALGSRQRAAAFRGRR